MAALKKPRPTPRARAPKPRSLLEFQKQFPDDATCAEFLFERRWPRGFICPRCGDGRASLLKSRAWTYQCQHCWRQTSITAGTIMHRSKLPLRTWFWAAHLMAIHSNGMSALQLRTQLKVRYPTAWLLAQKLRRAMVDPDREKLRGVVEIDQTEVPFRTKDSDVDLTKPKKILIIGAVEVIDIITQKPRPLKIGAKYLNTRAGRVRLAAIPNNSAAALQAFIRDNVEPGTTVITDAHRSYPGITAYPHDARKVKGMAAHIVLPWIHRVFSLLKRWGLGTFHGLRPKHVDRYLNEFVFRFNRRFYRHVSFEMILGLGAAHPPTTYWDIIDRQNPRHDKPIVRKQRRRRRTAFGWRYDLEKRQKPRKPKRVRRRPWRPPEEPIPF